MTTRRKPFKRFYKNAVVVTVEGGFTVELDGRRMRTPKAKAFVVPTRALGEAIAAEWQEQGESVNPQTMPMTGLANAAIDHVSADPKRFVDQILSYAADDLLCYRAEGPPRLIARQSELWDPLIAWAAERLGANFSVVTGVMPYSQKQETLEAVRGAVEGRDAFAMASIFSIVTLSGSSILGLAVVEQRLSAEEAWVATRVDETVQAEAWGTDEEAEARAARMAAELVHAERFLRLLLCD